ncbi:MAG: PAS domain-containing protein [Verrucomicrobiota bacterium]
MKKYPYQKAKKLIQSICKAAADGEYDTREKFHAMLEANPDVAVQGYNAYGKIFFWNQASAHLYGYSEAAAVNRDLFELVIPPEMRSLARDLILSATKTGKLPDPSSCDLIQRNGHFVTVFSGHLMFHWDGPAVPEFYCVDIDIDPEAV